MYYTQSEIAQFDTVGTNLVYTVMHLPQKAHFLYTVMHLPQKAHF